MFRILKKEIHCLYCEDENINKLPSVSQLNIIKAILPNQKIKKEAVPNCSERYSCFLLIAGEIYNFSCDFKEIEEDVFQIVDIDIKPYQFEINALLTDKNNVSDNSHIQINPSSPSNDEIKATPKVQFNQLNRKVYNLIANIKKEQIKEICNMDKEIFKIHAYEEYQKSTIRTYPYIYYYREKYTVCFNVTKTVVCRTQLIAKLLVGFYENENRRAFLLEADDVNDIQKLFVDVLFSRKQQELVEMLEHIDARICLDLLKMKKMENENENN